MALKSGEELSGSAQTAILSQNGLDTTLNQSSASEPNSRAAIQIEISDALSAISALSRAHEKQT